jgi:hypothetical protein
MYTAMLSVENILGADPPHDIWTVNVEAKYHEEKAKPEPAAPAATTTTTT